MNTHEWPFPSIPSQYEVDCISAYAQAVLELSVAPMFQEGQPHPQLGQTQDRVGGRMRYEFRVPDTFVLRATLPPFRRIWMVSEPSNYYKVCSIFKRHVFPEVRWYLDFMKNLYERERNSDDRLKHSLHDEKRTIRERLCARDFVELLLNTQVFHIGQPGVSDKKEKKPTRGDRQRIVDMLGPSRVEFLCADAFYDCALQSTNLMEMALFFLEELSRCGIASDIRIDEIELPGYQEFPDGTSIRRESPGYSQHPHTNGKKVELLRRERIYTAISQLFDAIPKNNEEIATAVSSSDDLHSCIESLGMEIATNSEESDDDGPLDFFSVRVGAPLIVRKGNRLQCDDIEGLCHGFMRFRNDLLRRNHWGTRRQQLWKKALYGYGIRFPVQRMQTDTSVEACVDPYDGTLETKET